VSIGRWIALPAALLTIVAAGAWSSFQLKLWTFPPRVDSPPVEPEEEQPYDASKGFPQPDAPPPVDPRQPEPRAVEARAAAIRRDAAAIRAECERAAGGDWEKWQQDTAPYRAALKARIDGLKVLPEFFPWYEALAPRDDFPLFELLSREHLAYLYDPATLDAFRRERPVVAAHRWLRRQGIDLIFVPVPKMTEVYVEHFLDPCPPDGIIAPHVRRTLLELLDRDVEVVGGLTLFRPVRDPDPEYLYNTADPHWAPRGMRVMAKEIAGRIERYRFGARARFALPIVRSAPGRYVFSDQINRIGGYGLALLSPEQRARAKQVQTTTLAEVRMQDGRKPPDDPSSPVLVIGHSYVSKFREQLVKELNLLTHTRAGDLQTTEVFADFLREPELLAHCRVVVWVTTEQHLTRFKPLPESVADCLKDPASPAGAGEAHGPASSR
jgi:hypothetical protein